jgi:TatD DNase family protein
LTALGLHPQLATERKHELPLFAQYLADARFIGEVGLDGTRPLRRTWSDQVAVFDSVLNLCADAGGRILSLHSRSAASAVLDGLERHPGAGTAVMHWFAGSKAELNRAVELGCWFSVNHGMVLSDKGRRLTQAMPRDRVLTETDGPFAQVGATPAEPHMVSALGEAMAEVWDVPLSHVSQTLNVNLATLLSDVPRS